MFGIFSGCGQKKANEVDFLFPTNFQGIIHIREVKLNGADVLQLKGVYKFIIPKNGDLEVKDLSPLRDFHKITPHYEDGLTIPYETSTNVAQLVLYELPGPQGDGFYYFVGSYLDKKVVSAELLFKKVPSGLKLDIQDGKILNVSN